MSIGPVYPPRGHPVWWVPIPTTAITITYPITYLSIGSVTEPEGHHPMNLTTMAELEAIPRAHVVRVDGDDWTRTEKGLSRSGIDLALAHFTGAVRRGAVLDVNHMPPTAGEWWEGQTRYYYINWVKDGNLNYQSFRNGGVIATSRGNTSSLSAWVENTRLHRLTGAPSAMENTPGMTAMVVAYGNLLNLYNDSQQAVREATDRLRRMESKAVTTAAERRNLRNSVAAIRDHLAVIETQFQE